MPISPSSPPRTRHSSSSEAVGSDLARRRQLGWHPDDRKGKRGGIVEAPRDALGIVERDRLDQGVALVEEVDAEPVLLKLDDRAGDAAGRIELQCEGAGEVGLRGLQFLRA